MLTELQLIYILREYVRKHSSKLVVLTVKLIFLYQKIDLFISKMQIIFWYHENIFWYQKRNIWCQKIIFDIRKLFLISETWFFDIRIYKGFSDFKNSNFWYQKIENVSWCDQKLSFWYQKFDFLTSENVLLIQKISNSWYHFWYIKEISSVIKVIFLYLEVKILEANENCSKKWR